MIGGDGGLMLSSSTLSAFSSTGVTLRSHARVEQPVEGFAVDVVELREGRVV